MRACVCVLLLSVAGVAFARQATTASASAHLAGVNALAGRRAPVTAVLDVLRRSPLEARFDIVQRHGSDVVREYDVDMTRRAHVIVIGDDFGSFQHVHPTLGTDGHFRFDLRVGRTGRYYVYADTDPHGLGQSVVRFTVPFGRAPLRAPDPTPSLRTARSGAYSASLDSLRLSSRTPTTLRVLIIKGGKPAHDLRPYLGGAAHAVFIDANTLAYVHIHPTSGGNAMRPMPGMAAMAMSHELPDDARVDPSMRLGVPATPAGSYRLWLQFRGADGLHVAPFSLVAR